MFYKNPSFEQIDWHSDENFKRKEVCGLKKVRKAIIPAAGLGTRFLPATKAMPKEMLPIVDKPTIQYIVEEAVASGIEDIIIVTGKGKRAIEDHFDNAWELEHNLAEKGKLDLLEKVRYSSNLANIHYIRQKQPLGLGHAVWCARNFIGDEPFAVLLGDDIVQSDTPCLKQLMDQFEQTHSSIIGVQEVPEEETHRYGIIDPSGSQGRRYQVENFVEKPAPGTAPSNLAIIGRYILTPEIFLFLEKQEQGAGGEIQLTDAIQKLNQIQRVFAYQFEGKRYDVGEKLGFIQTTIEIALQDPELKEPLLKIMDNILKETSLNKVNM
jgi:UTP--glucose-1-phosphate uridylyltransferase